MDSSEAPEALAASVVARQHATIPVQTVRALVAAHHADVANGTSEDNMLTLMIDSNGNYVGSAQAKQTSSRASRRMATPSSRELAERAVLAEVAGGVIAAAPAGAVARGGGGGATLSSPRAVKPGKTEFRRDRHGRRQPRARHVHHELRSRRSRTNALRVRFVILKSGVPK